MGGASSLNLSTATLSSPPVPYDPQIGDYLVAVSTVSSSVGQTTYYIHSDSEQYVPGSAASSEVQAPPYTGPVVQAPGISSPKRAGEKLTLSGSNLSGVSKVEIAGLDCQVVVNSAGEIEIVVPAGLAAGTYDLVVTSDSGRLVVQSAIVVAGSSAATSSGEVRPSTKRMADNTAKVWVFGVAGSGKVQILVNGREIAWVRTEDSSDSRLTNGYLVRTVELSQGKNVIEVLVEGERVRRTVYSN
jgi:hypothetical protein